MPAAKQAGAIAVSKKHRPKRFLIVRAKQVDGQWIFPKGHIEPDESPEAAALRELREEAGVEGRLLGWVGNLCFSSNGGLVDVDYFLFEVLDEGQPREGRERLWLNFDEAVDKLTFNDAKELLKSHRSQLAN
jgi:8-oxo-dGTP pyrophosphatase MutT (NUDIX family)